MRFQLFQKTDDIPFRVLQRMLLQLAEKIGQRVLLHLIQYGTDLLALLRSISNFQSQAFQPLRATLWKERILILFWYFDRKDDALKMNLILKSKSRTGGISMEWSARLVLEEQADNGSGEAVGR